MRSVDLSERRWQAAAATAVYVVAVWLLRVTAGSNELFRVIAATAYSAVPITLTGLCARTALRLRSTGWWYLTAAAVMVTVAAVGQLLDPVTDLADYPAPADIGFIAVLPLLGIGTWKLSHGSAGHREQLRSLFDGLLISTSIVLVFWWAVLGVERTHEMGTLGTAVALVYVFGDILVVTTMRSSREYDEPDRVDLRLFAGAFLVLGVADALFAYQVVSGTYGGDLLPDLGWTAGFAVLAWATYHGRPHSGRLERRRVQNTYLYGSLIAAVLVTVTALATNGRLDSFHAWGVVFLSLIAAAQHFVSQTENDELKSRLEQQVAALSRSEARFRNVFDGISDGIVVVDRSARITTVNASLARLVGRPAEELVGFDTREWLHSDDQTELVKAAKASAGEVSLVHSTVRHASGNVIPVEVTLSNLTDDPAVRGLVVSVRDISDRVQGQRELSESKERFRRSFGAAPIGMAVLASDGRILEANDAYARMLGRTVADITGCHVRAFTHPDDITRTQEHVAQLVASGSGVTRLEKRFIHADGHFVWGSLTVSVIPLPDGDHELVNQVEDVTDRRATLAQLAHNARHDTLTGLPNRAYFEEHLAASLERSHSGGARLAVAFLDVDRFKVVNDNLGHRAGDELLRVIAARLREACRTGDLVARFGGDEFTALFHDVPDEATAQDIVARLVTDVCRPIELEDGETFVSLSVGLALATANMDGSAVDLMLRNADAAMYRAKEAGRDRIELHEESADRETVNPHRLVNDLHRAVERDELVLHYQPIVSLPDERVVAVEGLLRWEHAELGRLPPARFMHLAEDSGLIVPIGLWTLDAACRQLAAWNEGADDSSTLRANVNVASRQLDAIDLVERTASVIEDTGVNPAWLWFEITESTLMRETTATIATLRRLRDLGVHLAIDDFGMGYSSLACLQRFPVEALKIDRSFVAGLGTEDEDATIARAIVDLAHALGLVAVAEGVETASQRARLAAIGCDYAQGFYFGLPTPAVEVAEPRDLRSWPNLSEPARPR